MPKFDMPFIDREPTSAEVELLQNMLSSFGDGSGVELEPNGITRVNWRQIERVFSEYFTGNNHREDKDVFDVVSPCWLLKNESYIGLSIKSKILKAKKSIFKGFQHSRLYMELSNSPAKFWAEIKAQTGLEEDAFRSGNQPDNIGNSVIGLVKKWHDDKKTQLDKIGQTIDLNRSCYLCVSFSDFVDGKRQVQIHSFDLEFPDVNWRYKSSRCLSGYSSDDPDNALFDWYGLSGGQLKYYPKASISRYSSPIFNLISVNNTSLIDKTVTLIPSTNYLIDKIKSEQRHLLRRDI
jgi:hypothetical protein